MTQELFKDLVKYLPSFLVPAITGILFLPVVTRLIDPGLYGIYVLIVSMVSILTVAASSWLDASVIRFHPEFELKGDLPEFYGLIIKIILVSIGIIGILAILACCIIRDLIPNDYYYPLLLGLILFALSSILAVFHAILRSTKNAHLYSFSKLWVSAGGICLGILLIIVFNSGIEGLLLGAIISIGTILPVLWYLSFGNSVSFQKPFNSNTAHEMLYYGIPLICLSILDWIQCLSDRYLLAIMRSVGEVGVYSISYTIVQTIMFNIITLFWLAAHPIAYSIWESQGVDASSEFNTKITRYYLIIGFPSAIGLSVLSPSIVRLLSTPAYYDGYQIIPFIAMGTFFYGIAWCYINGFNFIKNTKALVYFSLLAAVVNIAFNLVLIPGFGIVGAAVSTFISYLVFLCSLGIASQKVFSWKFPIRSFFKILLASLIMGATVHLLNMFLINTFIFGFIISILAGICIYLTALFLLHEMTLDEIKTFY